MLSKAEEHRIKPATYEALKTFDTRLHMAFPEATFRLIDPFEGYDVAVEVTLPVGKITWRDRMQLAEITASFGGGIRRLHRPPLKDCRLKK
jgi:hypothetical protein